MQVQRAIEMVGIPTVLITTDPKNSEILRPPRAIYPEGFYWGHSLGTAQNVALQREVLRTALEQLTQLHMPGKIITKQFQGYQAPHVANQS